MIIICALSAPASLNASRIATKSALLVPIALIAFGRPERNQCDKYKQIWDSGNESAFRSIAFIEKSESADRILDLRLPEASV